MFPVISKLLKHRFFRVLFILFLIYVVWSVLINLTGLSGNIDEEMLIPCLFYLPPLGFLALGIIAGKFVESLVVLRVIGWFRSRKKKV